MRGDLAAYFNRAVTTADFLGVRIILNVGDSSELVNAPRIPAMPSGLMGCAICGKPLRLAAATSENGGLPMHEDCYLLRLRLKQATMPQNQARLP